MIKTLIKRSYFDNDILGFNSLKTAIGLIKEVGLNKWVSQKAYFWEEEFLRIANLRNLEMSEIFKGSNIQSVLFNYKNVEI